MAMVRLQILLTPEENAALRLEAEKAGVSLSEVVRRRIRPLVDGPNVDRDSDPLLALEGFLGPDAEGITDGSVNHDHYLYDGDSAVHASRQSA